MKTLETKKSEYGRGLTYCLGLFLAHAERYNEQNSLDEDMRADLWFNAAADHLFELTTDGVKDKKLKKRLDEFQEKCITWRNSFGDKNGPKWSDVRWAIEEAKDLLAEIDRLELGLDVAKGCR